MYWYCDICTPREADVKVCATHLDDEDINTCAPCVICTECAKTLSLKIPVTQRPLRGPL